MSETLDIIVNLATYAAEECLLDAKRKPGAGKMHVLTVGDNPVPVTLWFYDGPKGSSSLTNVRKEGAQILLTGKVTRDSTKPLLFANLMPTEVQDALSDYGYAGDLNLNTTELRAEFPSGADREIFWEIVIDGTRRHQFRGFIRPRVWTGDEPDPTPALEGLMQDVLNQAAAATAAAEAATDAANDAVASVANKADKITGGTNDNLVKRDAGGNIADAGVAVSTDGTLASDSDAKLATEKAVKTYADTKATKVPAPTNDNIVLTDAAGNLVDSGESKLVLAQATTTQRGTAKTSTDAIAIAGTNTTDMLVPANLTAWAANDSRLGTTGGAHFTNASDAGTGPAAPFPLVALAFSLTDAGYNSTGVNRFIFRAGTLYTDGSLAVQFDASSRQARFLEGVGGVSVNSAYAAIPSGTRTLWVTHEATTRVLSMYADGDAAPFATYTRTYTGLLSSVNRLLNVAATASYTGFVSGVYALNRLPTAAERLAYGRGEYPAKDLGGAVEAVQGATTWTDSSYTASGGTVTTNTGGTLTVSHPGGGASASALRLSLSLSGNTCPTLRIGRAVRVIMTTAGVTGSIPVSLRDSAGTLLATATTVSTSAAQVLDFTLTATGNGSLEIHLGDTAAHAATITLAGITVLGAQVIVGPENWCHTRGRDISGNCNDLIYGAGVVPVSPEPFVRSFEVTTAGATVTAGTVATVGTLTGVAYRDKQAIAALRQWDGVKPSMGAADVANSTGLFGSATANSTLSIKSGATAAGNAVFAASTKFKVLVTE